MIQFTFQMIRYRPDVEAGEFVNVGVVLFSKQDQALRFEMIQRPERVWHFFTKEYTSGLIDVLKIFESRLENIQLEIDSSRGHLNFSSVEDISKLLGQGNDSSIFFSEAKKGRGINLENAIQNLGQRLLHRFEIQAEEASNFAEHLVTHGKFISEEKDKPVITQVDLLSGNKSSHDGYYTFLDEEYYKELEYIEAEYEFHEVSAA